MSINEWVLSAALAIGLVYGGVAQVSGFCLNSALRQQVMQGNGHKLRSFMLAVVVAMVGTQVASGLGLIDLSDSIYLTTGLSWLLIPLGGMMFGYGMIMARGCGARTLVLLGQGNLRSLVVLLCIGISAFMALTGVISPLRADVAQATSATLGSASIVGEYLRWGFVIAFCGSLLLFVFSDKQFLKQRKDIFGGLIIGSLVVAGWLATGWLGFDDFEPTPLTSLTFVGPVGSTIQYSMIATGMDLNFGIVVVLGVIIGSFIAAHLGGQFRLIGFEEHTPMPRYIIGGILMGVGGALAMGCSVGQGLTGLSTLSYVSMIAFAGILLGAWLALRRELSVITPPKPVHRQHRREQHQ